MKRELIIHLSLFVGFFLFASLFQGWFELKYLPLWFGGVLGTFLPDIDHLIYIYFLKPEDAISQKAMTMIEGREVKKTLELLAETSGQREKLIFHSVPFQVLFLVFAFLVITSSGSILGRGLVLAFSLSLFVDQTIDFMETGSISNWFRDTSINLDKEQQRWYLVAVGVVLLFFGFLL